MWRSGSRALPFISLLLTLCLGACTVQRAGDHQVVVTVQQPGDQVKFTVADRVLVFDIYSERGIGEATVQWLAGSYPQRIVLRFHLAGLEGLRLAYGATVLELALPSRNDPAPLQSVSFTGGGATQTITVESPYWMPTALVSGAAGAEPAIPLTDGWIEVQLPPDFLAAGYRTFSIQWVDFYR